MTREEKRLRFQQDIALQGTTIEDDYIAWMVFMEREFGLTRNQILEMPVAEFMIKMDEVIKWRKAQQQGAPKSGVMFR